jgi:hypothetical protein
MNNKPTALRLLLVFALALLGSAWAALLHAQSLHSLSKRSNLIPPKKSRLATPQATPLQIVPDGTDRQKSGGKPGRSVTWSGVSLTPHPSLQPTPAAKTAGKVSILKNKKTPHPELKGKWYSLISTPTAIPFNSKIKPLQPSKDSKAVKGIPVKVPTFSAWNMKFMKNQGSIYQGKNGKAASILLRLTPAETPSSDQ